MDEKNQREIVLDLSGKIKFSDTLYVSLGSLLLSALITGLQILICFAYHDWEFDPLVFTALLNFVTAIRGQSKRDLFDEFKNIRKSGE